MRSGDLRVRLESLGCSDRQIRLFQEETRDSVRDVFDALDYLTEATTHSIAVETGWSESTVVTALDVLRKGFGVVTSRTDPSDGRRVIYRIRDVPVEESSPLRTI